jgi:hypothetical protein
VGNQIRCWRRELDLIFTEQGEINANFLRKPEGNKQLGNLKRMGRTILKEP